MLTTFGEHVLVHFLLFWGQVWGLFWGPRGATFGVKKWLRQAQSEGRRHLMRKKHHLQKYARRLGENLIFSLRLPTRRSS